MTFAMNGLALWHMQPLKPCVSSSSTIHLHQSIHPINNAVMTSRLITPQLAEQFKQYPLYSQDGKKKDAICQCVFFIGKVRWYVLEGQPEGNDFTLFSIVVGLADTEYGYASIKEMESISVDVGHNLPKIPILQDKSFKPCPIGNIPDERLQSFLSDMYDREEV